MMAPPLLHLPPPHPPSIMGAPQGVYKWPWKTAAECPPARAPATSPVSTFPADMGERKAARPTLGVGVHVSYPQGLPWPWRLLLEWHQLSSPVQSCRCPLDTDAAPQCYPRISSPGNLHLQPLRQPPCSPAAPLFPQSSMAWCYCVKCVETLPQASTMACMPVRAAR